MRLAERREHPRARGLAAGCYASSRRSRTSRTWRSSSSRLHLRCLLGNTTVGFNNPSARSARASSGQRRSTPRPARWSGASPHDVDLVVPGAWSLGSKLVTRGGRSAGAYSRTPRSADAPRRSGHWAGRGVADEKRCVDGRCSRATFRFAHAPSAHPLGAVKAYGGNRQPWRRKSWKKSSMTCSSPERTTSS
jgi:hypothetical protein